jgi:hypothetical protein
MVVHEACHSMRARLHTLCQPFDNAPRGRRRASERGAARSGRWLSFPAVIVLAVVAIVGGLGGCGEVHFIPSPYTPVGVESVFSAQEQVTVIRWRLGAAAPVADTQFQLLGPDGYVAIDFSKSVFPGGVAACTDGHGACAQYVVRGKAAIADGDHPVQAVHPTFGVLPGGPAKTRTATTTLTVQSYFHFHNDFVYVNMADAIAADGPYQFPRSYERAMWSTSGLCVSDAAPDGATFAPLDASGGVPPEQPLTDAGTYCVASRPVPSDAGVAAMVQTRIATLPEVETRVQVFDPPIEQAPVIYQIVLDLEIPVPDRCASAIQMIETLVDSTLGRAPVPVRKLPTLNLAQTAGGSPCAQTDSRALAAADMADAVKMQVMSFPEVHQQFHFLYFNNLDSPLPRSLTDSMHAFFDALAPPAGYDLQTLSWLFNPGAAGASDLSWWRSPPYYKWIAADDPSFGKDLKDYTDGSLPYESQLHDPSEPVPLLSDAETPRYGGARIKICDASPRAVPLASVKDPTPIYDWSWTIDPSSPPAYLVSLQPEIAVSFNQFVEENAIVHYQICTRYCVNHPYRSDAGDVTSWAGSPLCTTKDY